MRVGVVRHLVPGGGDGPDEFRVARGLFADDEERRSRAVRGEKMVTSYTVPDRVATVGWGSGPLRVGVKARQGGGGLAGFGRPSVSFSVDRSFDFDPFPAPAPPPPPPPKTNPLLDWLNEAGSLGRSIKGVAVETFARAKATA